MEHGKLDHYVRCEIPEVELERYPGHGTGFRGSILVHPEGVDLSKYSTKYGRVGMDRVPEARLYGPARYGRDRLREAPPYMDPWSASQQATPILTGAWHQASDALPVPSGEQLCWGTSDSEEYAECAGSNWQGNLYTSFGDGSYHYDNCDGSSYDRHADGSATFVDPQGEVHEYPAAYNGECAGGYGHDEECDRGAFSDSNHGSVLSGQDNGHAEACQDCEVGCSGHGYADDVYSGGCSDGAYSDGGGHADTREDDGEYAGHDYGGGCSDCGYAEDVYSGGDYDGGYSDGGYSYGGYDDEW